MGDLQNSEKSKLQKTFLSAIAGGAAGIIVDLVYYPIETIKTRVMASNKDINYQKQSQHLSKYKGFSLQMFSSFPFAFIFFYSYEGTKQILIDNFQSINASYHHIISASFAESLANSIRNPFEVMKQQQQVGHDNKISQTFKHIYNQKGIRGFYVGFSVLLLRDIPFSIIQWPLYEFLKKGKKDPSALECGAYGSIAAFVASFLTTPMDLIKTKMMTQRDFHFNNTLHCFQQTYQEGGIKGLFKGVQYRAFPLAFTGTIFFTAFEKIKTVLIQF